MLEELDWIPVCFSIQPIYLTICTWNCRSLCVCVCVHVRVWMAEACHLSFCRPDSGLGNQSSPLSVQWISCFYPYYFCCRCHCSLISFESNRLCACGLPFRRRSRWHYYGYGKPQASGKSVAATACHSCYAGLVFDGHRSTIKETEKLRNRCSAAEVRTTATSPSGSMKQYNWAWCDGPNVRSTRNNRMLLSPIKSLSRSSRLE